MWFELPEQTLTILVIDREARRGTTGLIELPKFCGTRLLGNYITKEGDQATQNKLYVLPQLAHTVWVKFRDCAQSSMSIKKGNHFTGDPPSPPKHTKLFFWFLLIFSFFRMVCVVFSRKRIAFPKKT